VNIGGAAASITLLPGLKSKLVYGFQYVGKFLHVVVDDQDRNEQVRGKELALWRGS